MVKEISLTNGEVAICDDEDYPLLSLHKWARVGNFGYPAIVLQTTDAKQKWHIWMHRLVVPGYQQTDHINHNPLDCRRANLRPVTKQQNQWNARKMKPKDGSSYSSKYKGVYGNRTEWFAQITKDKKTKRRGPFQSEEAAALWYNAQAKELYGEYACLNQVG